MKRVLWESRFRKCLTDFQNNLLTFPNHAFAAMTIVNYQGNVIVKVDMRPTCIGPRVDLIVKLSSGRSVANFS